MYSSVLVLLLFCLHYKYIEDSVSGLCLFNAKSQQFLKMNFFRHDIVEKLLSATITHSLTPLCLFKIHQSIGNVVGFI
jgi:hypothetical protein